MALIYKPLGNYIHQVDERNKDLVTDLVLGINIDKYFMPSVANVIGTDLSNYKLLRNERFACNPMHVGRDERLPVSLYKDDVPAIVSPAYFMFEINDTNELDPEYLMLCFRRPLFDKFCTFKTDASVRGGISWEDLCSIDIPMPSTIEEQRKIVNDYKVITDRIDLLNLIDNKIQTYLNFAFNQFLKEYKNESKIVDVNELIEIQSGLAYDAEFLTENESDNLLISMSNASLGKIFIPNKMKHYSISVDNKYCGHSGDLFVPTRDLTQACNILSCPAIIPDYYSDNNIILGTNLYKIEKYFYGEETKYWLYLLFNSSDYRKYIKECANGSAILMIKKEDILNYKIAIPNDKDLFCKFNERVKSLFEIRNVYYSEIQNLLKLKELILINMGRGVK